MKLPIWSYVAGAFYLAACAAAWTFFGTIAAILTICAGVAAVWAALSIWLSAERVAVENELAGAPESVVVPLRRRP